MTDIRIIISGGGTGGHIFPAIAIANAIKQKEPHAEILFVGAQGKIEMDKVPAAGYRIVGLPVRGLHRSFTLKNLTVMFNFLRSLFQSRSILKQFKPTLVIGVGGYASAPVLAMAALSGCPAMIQEQNSYAGLTNRLLARFVKRVCVAYPAMERFFVADKIVVTGNPVRQAIIHANADKKMSKKEFGISETQKMVLVLGGSGGARTMNSSIVSAIEKIRKRDDIVFVLQTGQYYFEKTKTEIEQAHICNVKVYAFINDMVAAYAAADLVVSRSGAGTISELCLLGKPSVFVPSPNVAENHQYKNAESLLKSNAAMIVNDDQADKMLVDVVLSIIDNDNELARLAENIKKHAYPEADEKIAEQALLLIKNY